MKLTTTGAAVVAQVAGTIVAQRRDHSVESAVDLALEIVREVDRHAFPLSRLCQPGESDSRGPDLGAEPTD